MILLDTNVISEPWKPVPDEAVIAWLDAQAVETLFISAITIAELRAECFESFGFQYLELSLLGADPRLPLPIGFASI